MIPKSGTRTTLDPEVKQFLTNHPSLALGGHDLTHERRTIPLRILYPSTPSHPTRIRPHPRSHLLPRRRLLRRHGR
ncbi:uncharacterized protein BO80DRAFT_426551 [Aspergillus ibericus CBS 121593]|uniref:Uncharacterized protein n=1 Tax=Aspergillus ibericus CBS 121593 TaxID=1448316 RepID=A0A395GZ04_9EURO|nr:hypothetical protein BO80DRAFT_426551 [Aspergillus ibericus CBS 121593]RAK99253.1 hypothetical protein BO80DRAFT_426551 [Aspergillus ibericus CBS 121593]